MINYGSGAPLQRRIRRYFTAVSSNRVTYCVIDYEHLVRYYLDNITSYEDVSICEEKHFSTHHRSAPYDSNFIQKCEKPVIYDDRCHRTASTSRQSMNGDGRLTENDEINVVIYYAKNMGYTTVCHTETSRNNSPTLHKLGNLSGAFTRRHCVGFVAVDEHLLELLALIS